MIKIVIADDHPIFLEGLNTHLKNNEKYQIFTARNGSEALELIHLHHPEVAILDIEMPHLDGLSIARLCKEQNLKTRLVILSYHKEPEFLARAKQLNLHGYILKEDSIDEIEQCLSCILQGETYFSAVLNDPSLNILDSIQERISQLSPSERKILKLVEQKLSTKQIADKLFISERTVEKHRSNIIQKLNIDSKTSSLYEWTLDHKGFIN